MSLKTYVITVSKKFLANHPRKGDPTNFEMRIKNKKKIHTIRGNYQYWEKIVREVNAGNGILSVRQWSDRPYKSKQVEICTFSKLGIQKVNFTKNAEGTKARIDIDGKWLTTFGLESVAKHDGFKEVKDFIAWFPEKFEGCVIHFSELRY